MTSTSIGSPVGAKGSSALNFALASKSDGHRREIPAVYAVYAVAWGGATMLHCFWRTPGSTRTLLTMMRHTTVHCGEPGPLR